MSGARPHLIAYDIRDPQRLGKVHRYLRRQALPVQYSVFVAPLTAEGARRLLAGLGRIVSAEDDVRIYALGRGFRLETIGGRVEGIAVGGWE